jgi:hypothetical protein
VSDTEDWLADVFGPEPSAAPPVQPADAETPPQEDVSEAPDMVDLDDSGDTSPRSPDESAPDANAGAKKTAIALGAGLVVAVTAIVAALVTFGDSPAAPPPRSAPAASAAPVPAAAPAEVDQAVPFTASANCPAGSTSAQALTDTGSDSAWVCVRGGEGAAVDGQVLHVDLGRTFVLTAVSVTPGWVAKTAGGKEEWLQHRVVTRLQYIFNDTDRTIVTQDTGKTHGPVVLPLRKILASRVTVIVLQTSRPPAGPLPSAGPTTAPSGGFLDSVLGAGGAPLPPDATATTDPPPLAAQGSDPVDATFAMSALKFLGHQPN